MSDTFTVSPFTLNQREYLLHCAYTSSTDTLLLQLVPQKQCVDRLNRAISHYTTQVILSSLLRHSRIRGTPPKEYKNWLLNGLQQYDTNQQTFTYVLIDDDDDEKQQHHQHQQHQQRHYNDHTSTGESQLTLLLYKYMGTSQRIPIEIATFKLRSSQNFHKDIMQRIVGQYT
jgi:hypothetical protein